MSTTTDKPKLYYTLRRSDSQPHFHHLTFEVWSQNHDRDGKIDRSDYCPQFIVTFQSDEESHTKEDWYAFCIRVEGDYYFPESTRLALRFLKPLERNNVTPQMVLSRLATLGAAFVIYDSRESQYLPPDKIAGPNYFAWRDIRSDTDHCTVGCLARDESEAKRLLTIEFAKFNSTYEETFTKWVAEGRPVRRLDTYYNKPPEIYTPEILVNWTE